MVYSVFRHYHRSWNVPGQFGPTRRVSTLKAFNLNQNEYLVLAKREVLQPLNQFDVDHTLIEWAVVSTGELVVPKRIPKLVALNDGFVPQSGLFIECVTSYPDGRKPEVQFIPRVATFARNEIKYATEGSANRALAFIAAGAANLKNLLESAGKLPVSPVQAGNPIINSRLSRFYKGIDTDIVEPDAPGALILNDWDEAFGWL